MKWQGQPSEESTWEDRSKLIKEALGISPFTPRCTNNRHHSDSGKNIQQCHEDMTLEGILS